MRLWSLHPGYLDRQGLAALWREALLAQKVLLGKTRGYRNHPQLERFKACHAPAPAIAAYLFYVWEEAGRRGYEFDRKKIGRKFAKQKIPVTDGQLRYEFKWLCQKLKKRAPGHYRAVIREEKIRPNPFFKVIHGPVQGWEKVKK